MNREIKSIEKELQNTDQFKDEWIESSFPVADDYSGTDDVWMMKEEEIKDLVEKSSKQKSTYAINCKALLEKEDLMFPKANVLEKLKASVAVFSKYIPSVAFLKRKLEGAFDEAHALHRFHVAQDKKIDGYADALEQVKAGRKTSHWIWYIFPQMKGLGHSDNSKYYGIRVREEAERYINDPVLRNRLIEITDAVLSSPYSVGHIFGHDVIKVRSCMKLFASVSDDPVFKDMLEKKSW